MKFKLTVILLSIIASIAGCKTIGVNHAKHSAYSEQYKDLVIDGVRISYAVCSPTSGGMRGAVLIVPGSLYSDVDGNYPIWNARPNFYADIARNLAKRGYKTLRYAKYGPGTGSEVIDSAQAQIHTSSFLHRVNVAHKMGLELLRGVSSTIPFVVAGHSEGALVAIILGKGNLIKPAGVISVSSTAKRYLDMVLEGSAQMASKVLGVASGEEKVLLEELSVSFEKLRAGKSIAEDLKTNPLLGGFSALGEAGLNFVREHDSFLPTEEVKQLDIPVLFLHGEKDTLVNSDNAKVLAGAVSSTLGEFAVLSGLSHFFKKWQEASDKKLPHLATGPTDERLIKYMDDWIERKIIKE